MRQLRPARVMQPEPCSRLMLYAPVVFGDPLVECFAAEPRMTFSHADAFERSGVYLLPDPPLAPVEILGGVPHGHQLRLFGLLDLFDYGLGDRLDQILKGLGVSHVLRAP